MRILVGIPLPTDLDLYYSFVPNCRGGHFAIFGKKSPQFHFIITPPPILWIFPKKVWKSAKTFIFLEVFGKITPISLYNDPPHFIDSPQVPTLPAYSTPLQLSTKEYLFNIIIYIIGFILYLYFWIVFTNSCFFCGKFY